MQTAFIITGSPRKNGVTTRMARAFCGQWEKAARDNRTMAVNAYEAAVQPCIHCGRCQKTPSCVYDDYAVFDAGFQTSDILVIASPVYGLGFPAPLKAVFDRTQRYFEAKFSPEIPAPDFPPKKALLLTASGSGDPQGPALMRAELNLVCKALNALLCGVVSVYDTDSVPPDYDRVEREIARFLSAITPSAF
jgi:multimeric flavodoxin WrbA